MRTSLRGLCTTLLVLVVGSAAADDTAADGNPYARKTTAPKLPVHSSLVSAVHDKISQCFQLEQGKPVSAEQDQLLRAFGKSVARDLSAGFASTGCALAQVASKECLAALKELPCERLAEPIVAAGWDRNLDDQARQHVATYATALIKREVSCGFLDDEPVSLGIHVSRMSVLIESEIVMGKCELHPELRAQCDEQLAATACSRVAALGERGELSHACVGLMRCRDLPEH